MPKLIKLSPVTKSKTMNQKNVTAIKILRTAGMSKQRIRGITINTDASFHPVHFRGGYAFHIVCDLFTIKKSGMFQHTCHNSTDAEVKCIANALATLLAQRELPKLQWIHINTDSKMGIQFILNGTTDAGSFARDLIKQLMKRTGCTRYKLRHVKAHSGVQDGRSLANEWCDREAKQWMRTALKTHHQCIKTK